MSLLSPKKQLRWIMGLYQKAKWKMTFWEDFFFKHKCRCCKTLSLSLVYWKNVQISLLCTSFLHPVGKSKKIRSAHKKRTFEKYSEGNRYLCINGDMPFSFVCIQYIILWFMEQGRLFYTTCWLHILKHLLSHIISAPILSHYIFKHVAISVFSKLFFNMSLSLYHSNWYCITG